MPILSILWEAVKPTLVVWGFGFSVMTVVELLAPRERQSLGGRLPGLLFWAIWLAISGIAYAGFRTLWSALGIPPLLTLPTGAGWQTPVSLVVAPLVGAVTYDFFFYWCHRAQHRWLWRYHAVHHSIRELSAVNAFHHPIEPFVQILLIAVPTSLIANEAGPVVPAILIVRTCRHSSSIRRPAGIWVRWQASWSTIASTASIIRSKPGISTAISARSRRCGTGCSVRRGCRRRTNGPRPASPRSTSRARCTNGSRSRSPMTGRAPRPNGQSRRPCGYKDIFM